MWNQIHRGAVQLFMDIHGPFLGSEALAAGLVNRYQLSTHYQPVFRGVYIPRGYELTASAKARAAWLFSRRRSVVAGVSAAALHGSRWIDAQLPAELFQPSRFRTPGLVLHSDKLLDDEVGMVGGCG